MVRTRKPLLAGITAGLLLVGGAVGQTPAPQPTPKPAPVTPAAPDVVPKASLTGMYWSNAQAGSQGPGTVLGLFVLDASASVSTKPIKWKVKGPQVTLIVLSPAEGTASSVAQAYCTTPGRYQFVAIAQGTVGGQPDAEADVFLFTVPDPTPAPAPVPVPTPTPTPAPTPNPTPNPPRPFPSTQLNFRGGVIVG
jgi:hypothetical protein